ncbi:acetyltransferase [Spartinivicinus marinus]|nr:acetyltransferase [Spartinivicinus marinus]MCX4028814.1 acetyltransferase [Spartinivicinus marinus]
MKKIIIFGVSDAAELAYYYFTNDSDYQVTAFTVDSKYIPEGGKFCGLPVVEFENVVNIYPTDEYNFFVAVGYSNLNKIREEKYHIARSIGYKLVSYISSKAIILNNNCIGDNCFILENNIIQPFVNIGNNITLWSGNHIGHHTKVGDHCFLASHIVISGRVNIGKSCFIGVNATLRDNISVGKQCVIGAGTLLLNDVEEFGVYKGHATHRSKASSMRISKI